MKKENLIIGSDHGGFNLKNKLIEYLQDLGHSIEDYGCYDDSASDYPDIAFKVAEKVASNGSFKGILVCGTGQGMAIAANKVKGIRAACCSDVYCAKMVIEHNDVNVLTMGERVIDFEMAKQIVNTWLDLSFKGNRHERRLNKISSYESQTHNQTTNIKH